MSKKKEQNWGDTFWEYMLDDPRDDMPSPRRKWYRRGKKYRDSDDDSSDGGWGLMYQDMAEFFQGSHPDLVRSASLEDRRPRRKGSFRIRRRSFRENNQDHYPSNEVGLRRASSFGRVGSRKKKDRNDMKIDDENSLVSLFSASSYLGHDPSPTKNKSPTRPVRKEQVEVVLDDNEINEQQEADRQTERQLFYDESDQQKETEKGGEAVSQLPHSFESQDSMDVVTRKGPSRKQSDSSEERREDIEGCEPRNSVVYGESGLAQGSIRKVGRSTTEEGDISGHQFHTDESAVLSYEKPAIGKNDFLTRKLSFGRKKEGNEVGGDDEHGRNVTQEKADEATQVSKRTHDRSNEESRDEIESNKPSSSILSRSTKRRSTKSKGKDVISSSELETEVSLGSEKKKRSLIKGDLTRKLSFRRKEDKCEARDNPDKEKTDKQERNVKEARLRGNAIESPEDSRDEIEFSKANRSMMRRSIKSWARRSKGHGNHVIASTDLQTEVSLGPESKKWLLIKGDFLTRKISVRRKEDENEAREGACGEKTTNQEKNQEARTVVRSRSLFRKTPIPLEIKTDGQEGIMHSPEYEVQDTPLAKNRSFNKNLLRKMQFSRQPKTEDEIKHEEKRERSMLLIHIHDEHGHKVEEKKSPYS